MVRGALAAPRTRALRWIWKLRLVCPDFINEVPSLFAELLDTARDASRLRR
jgi:hypothetical protein